MNKHYAAPDTTRCRQVAALPWRLEKDGSISVLLITSRTNAKWMLPKGWPMDGKSDAESALQETREEAGIDGTVSPSPIGSYHYIKLFDDGKTTPSQAIIYSLRVTGKQKDWDEKGQRRRRWFSAEKAAKAVFEPDLARFLSKVATGRVPLN